MGNENQSSLSREATHPLRSSAPSPTHLSSLEMDGITAPKSETAAPQDGQQTPKQPQHNRIASDDTERPASAQRIHDDSEEHSDIEVEPESSEIEDTDPAMQIAGFDWNGLHERYHAAIDGCSQEEAALMEEWSNLMKVLCFLSYGCSMRD
ncbi:uncharacterized protein EKO05_0002369 [Ascochyta rabiei]|uniref:uncharacterized protein n=1 Tax=Didymella rabiei TaxID=5454 RepID=UPI00220A71CD|nr:uncharacterized protein EKO05_0002369 [Ascochyta rabiei]UPX11781.1 hypothetical protein EKO05_0002369 [Ascochyta rabiei]